MSFWGELKRRNVIRIGVAYLATAWLLIQVANTVLPVYSAPAWVMEAVIFTSALGFPFAVILAWFHVVTPESGAAAGGMDGAGTTSYTGRKIDFVIIGVLVLAVGFLVAGNDLLNNRDSVSPNSIAVLPFVNLSSDPEQEYFSDGLTEELLNKLAQMQDLQVTSRTSSFYFKGRNEDLREIGEMLGVANLLEGSVRRSGSQLRITAQLIKAADGFHLWSATFDREMADIFSIQDEIADAVATALSVTLGIGEHGRTGMTRNIAAYDAYLQGLSSYDAGDFASILPTIDHYRRAVSLDPRFALAWLKLQEAYATARLYLPAEQTTDFRQLGIDALEQAGAIAPDMPELSVRNAESNRRDGHWLEAEKLFLKVLEQSGNSNAQANYLYGHLLASVGRSQDALPYLQRAKRLDPLTPDIATQMARVLVGLNRFDEANAEADRGISLGNARATIFLNSIKAMSAYAEGDAVRAAVSIGALASNNPDDPYLQMANLLASGDIASALSRLQVLVEDQTLGPVANSAFALFASITGDAQLTLRFLQKQANANVHDLLGSNPMWHGYFSDMRRLAGFKELARAAGLVEYWRATGQWGDFCKPLGADDFECS